MKKREFCIILGSALLAAGVSGCKESASKKYSSAQELINKGEYSEAVKKLREITSYEDSSQLLLYASANAAAVEGSFSEAITTLQSLGDYKDSQNLIVYYSAKQAEAQEDVYDIQYIASLYESIPLFRDSKEQEEAYLSGWYQTAVTDAEAENYAEAYPIFDNLGSYNDSDKMIDYYEARRLEAEGDYISMLKAKRVYDTMPQVVDCADRSSKILETLQTVYKDAQSKMKEGNYEQALKMFASLGSYEDSADLADKLEKEIANQKLYKAAEDSLSKQDYADAIKKFGELGSYADAKQRKEAIQQARYEAAEKMMNDEDFEGAIAEFQMLGSYKESKKNLNLAKQELTKQNAYKNAEQLYEKEDYKSAIQQFAELGEYKDAANRKKEIQAERYKAAEDLIENGDLEGAIAEFEMLGSYKDAKQRAEDTTTELANKTSYEEAEGLLAKGDYAGAVHAFAQLRDYKDAAEREKEIQEQRYEEADKLVADEDFESAIAIFEELGNYQDSSDRITATVQAEYEKAEQFYVEDKLEESEQLLENLTAREYQDSQKYLAYVRAAIAQKNKDYNTAIKILKGLQDYKDSKNLLIYYEALEQSESKQVEDIQKTVEALKSIPQVKDSNEQLENYQKTWYDNAIASGDSGEYDNAIKILEALKSYEDSSDLVTYYKARRYEFKDTNDDRMRAIAMYEKIPEVKDSKERKEAIVGIQEGIYAKAEEQLEADKFFDAKETFQSLGNYSDAKQRVKDTEKARQDKIKLLCANQRYAEALHFQNLQSGDVIKFGEYEQDNNFENGKEAIDWIVLDVQDDEAFILSEKCLDARIFSETWEMSEWTGSNIREWLNGDFMQTAFSSNLQDLIVCKEIKNERDPYYAVSYGEEDTLDYVFLLSYNEATQYLKNKTAYGTLYACAQYDKQHTNLTASPDKEQWWWLRTIAYGGETRMGFNGMSGGAVETGSITDAEMVRPAMRIDLAKCEEVYQHAYDTGELDNLPITEIPETEEATEDSEVSSEVAEQNISEDLSTNENTNSNMGNADITETYSQTQETTAYTPTGTTGNAAAVVNPAIRDRSDYLCIDQNEATGQILLYFYLCPGSNGMYNSIACDNEYLECGPSGNAKELVDRSLSGELGVLPGYGDKKTIVWNSPYGICAYSRSQSQYLNGTNGDYMLNEGEIYQMLNTMGVSIEMVPNSQKQD